jgi:hypothetical protein
MTTERWIARVERSGIGLGCVVGIAAWLALPAARGAITRPMLLVAGGVTLPAVGRARDLARLALEDRSAVAGADTHPGELRLCLESTLGLAAVIASPLGALVLALAAVAALGHVVRHLVVVIRREPAHRNVVFCS